MLRSNCFSDKAISENLGNLATSKRHLTIKGGNGKSPWPSHGGNVQLPCLNAKSPPNDKVLDPTKRAPEGKLMKIGYGNKFGYEWTHRKFINQIYHHLSYMLHSLMFKHCQLLNVLFPSRNQIWLAGRSHIQFDDSPIQTFMFIRGLLLPCFYCLKVLTLQ